MDKKLIVISIDSFITEDLEIMKKLPNFGRVIEKASIVKKNLTTYPSLTHSVHTTIQTGCRPGKHGVVNNEKFQPFEKAPQWFDEAKDICIPTFADEIKAQTGATTALVFWPLIMGAKADWVIRRPGVNGPHGDYSDWEDELIKTSTPGIYTGQLYERCKDAWENEHYYDWDEFAARACEQMIYMHQPDVMITHMTVIDAERHHHGVFNDTIQTAYEFLDRGLGYILKALDDTGLADKTIICVTSDHGHINIKRTAHPNVLLEKYGYLTVTENGDLKDYEVFAHGSGLCCPIYIKDKSPENIEKMQVFFEEHKKELGVSEVLMPDTLMEEYGLKGDFSFMLETDNDTSFTSELTGEIMTYITGAGARASCSTHGHRPEKGVQPCLIVADPFKKEKVIIENNLVINQAPTFAAFMGASMPQADGVPIKELL